MMNKSGVSEADLEEKILICKDCGNKFAFTTGEQKFFIDKGLQNIPKRCKPCAAKFRAALHEKHPVWWIKCKNCGKKAEVPFEPLSEDILCESCFGAEIEKRDKAISELKDKS
ncbi:MAG: zinc-ribbon domain containing protein [Candidatus Berkelbacteria bacterium]